MTCCGEKPRTAVETHKQPFTHLSKPIWDPEDKSNFTSTEYEALRKAVAALGPPKVDLWLQELERGEVDVFVALLLSLLPNLREIDLETEFEQETDFVKTILKQSFTLAQPQILSAFKGLTLCFDIHWCYEVPSFNIELDMILLLFYRPKMEYISAYFLDEEIIWPLLDMPVSQITSLELPSS